ncbi:hypothetical protein Tco_0852577 [Tanacetum coccineum]
MCTYLKIMEGYKLKHLKLKEFDFIQEMFDRAFKRITKKQKVEDDKEIAELKLLMKIIPDEVVIDAIPLAVESPSIVGLKIFKGGRKSYYQIMRADGKSQMYMFFSQMLKSFDREDLEDLYKLVKAKYESTKPVEDLDLLLWGDLKTMFEPHVEDKVWRNQQEYKVLNWKLYDSCRVHSLMMQHMQIYMLVKKKYPLAPLTFSMMLEKKLMIDYESKMPYQLLKFIIKQLKKSNLRNKTAYTAYSDPQGVIYKDQNNINRLMRADELHKFCDGTLNDVWTALYDIALGIRMEYMSKRKWSGLDKRRARVMIQDIVKQLFQKWLMRNLEKLVGGREYRNDLKLLELTI